MKIVIFNMILFPMMLSANITLENPYKNSYTIVAKQYNRYITDVITLKAGSSLVIECDNDEVIVEFHRLTNLCDYKVKKLPGIPCNCNSGTGKNGVLKVPAVHWFKYFLGMRLTIFFKPILCPAA